MAIMYTDSSSTGLCGKLNCPQACFKCENFNAISSDTYSSMVDCKAYGKQVFPTNANWIINNLKKGVNYEHNFK